MDSLYLGVACELITPKVGAQLYGYRTDIFAESVSDDLTVTAFYFKQGEKEALMLSAVVCLVQTELARQILCRIQEELDIPAEYCILSATHTHSGPNTAGTYGWGDIDRASDIPYVLSLSNANGSEGYFVSQNQICHGGYEVSMFMNGHLQAYCQNADSYAIKETLKNLKEGETK